MYIDSFESDQSKYGMDSQDALLPLVEIALEVSQFKEFTGIEKPTVITWTIYVIISRLLVLCFPAQIRFWVMIVHGTDIVFLFCLVLYDLSFV